ncbi:helix-turn-helix transcriptional regulator [Klebsiella oxytoca]|uniref:helix-turn-helix transcriptional regulator n=1 Tax=Klebsiella oxytoca TaxID=571 RepID=UPI00224807B6|nr:LuxR C-terminal-related transcriptional regulator [Klebsiella oxytoca]MCW9445970.1 LuxR C-terminal-related transcriptional regulator [Klebsiella oxytoca]
MTIRINKRTKVKIYGHDNYFKLGVLSILNDLHKQNIELFKEIRVNIFIFTGEFELSTFKLAMTKIERNDLNIFIGNEKYLSFFDCISKSRFSLMNINCSAETFKNLFISALWLYKANTEDHNNSNHGIELKPNEKEIVDMLVNGYTPTYISNIKRISTKSISNYKRAAMKALKANNIVELTIKYKVMSLIYDGVDIGLKK